jgi:hypothetical protein
MELRRAPNKESMPITFTSIPNTLASIIISSASQCWFTVKQSIAGRQTSSNSQTSASHFLGLQGLQHTPDLYSY